MSNIQYKVQMESKAGPYEQYEDLVYCYAEEDADSESIFHAACRQLKRTSFPERDASCWQTHSYEVAS